jgi:pyrimidine operon attenuation protein/uracil phosphoribosyltransferase
MSTDSRVIVPPAQLALILKRLVEELLERHPRFDNTVLIGLQPRGVFFLNRLEVVLQSRLAEIRARAATAAAQDGGTDALPGALSGALPGAITGAMPDTLPGALPGALPAGMGVLPMPPTGVLDVTFYRDDFRHRAEPLSAHSTKLSFSLEGKKVVLVDDVLFTGRTIRAGLDALLDFGRPDRVELMVLVTRRYRQEFPIHPDYCGIDVNTHDDERVRVCWDEPGGAHITLIKSNG